MKHDTLYLRLRWLSGINIKKLANEGKSFWPVYKLQSEYLGLFTVFCNDVCCQRSDDVLTALPYLYLGSDFCIPGEAKPVSRRKCMPLGVAFPEGCGQHWHCLSTTDKTPAASERVQRVHLKSRGKEPISLSDQICQRSTCNLHGLHMALVWLWRTYHSHLKTFAHCWWVRWPGCLMYGSWGQGTTAASGTDWVTKGLRKFQRESVFCVLLPWTANMLRACSSSWLAGQMVYLCLPESSCSTERRTLVLTPCHGLFSFQTITSDTADKEPACQCSPWRGESSSLPILVPQLPAHAFSDHAGHQVRRNSAGSWIAASKPCPTHSSEHFTGKGSSRTNFFPSVAA